MSRPRLRLALATAALVGLARPAAAQMGGGPSGFGGPGGGMQPPPAGQNSEKEEGPAEEAPEENRPVDLEPLSGYPEQNRRKMQIFELDGYLRLRSDYMHDFFLGLGYSNVPSGSTTPGTTNYGLPPFPLPLECPSPLSTTGVAIAPNIPGSAGQNCSHKNVGGANLRFRLEPTLNITDQVRIHAQFDVLDNTILGSTPDSLAGIQGFNRPPSMTMGSTNISPTTMPGVAPSAFLSTTQDPPQIGQNGFTTSIVAKRAWAEIDSEFGSVRFGRMPWNWGRGLFYNDGGCADCDVGTTVDRAMALTTIYGHQLAAAWDLGAQGYTTQQLSLGRDDPSGYPYDLSQNDDVLELMASVTRIENPVQLRERIDRGDLVFNYGLQVVYRNQGNTVVPIETTGQTTSPYGPQPLTPDQLPRAIAFDGISVTPDVWFKLYYKALTIEAEGIGVFGRILHPGALAAEDKELKLAEAGWVVASELRLFKDSFFVGFEVGGATGDQASDPGQYLNYRWRYVQQPVGDNAIHDFHFSPDYHVDEIFFRHIMGTVTNATYFKPSAAYWFDLGQTRAIGLNGSVIYSIAQVPVSTPGDALTYGLEVDTGIGYRNTAEGFYAGATWGILWPFSALSRPAPLWSSDSADASSAQILRIYMGVKF